MRELSVSKRYMKDRDKCSRKGYDLSKLDEIVEILKSRPLTADEVKKYKVHKLDGKHKGYTGLHIGGPSSDWVLKYQSDGKTLFLEATGKHDDVFKGASEEIPDNLIWL